MVSETGIIITAVAPGNAIVSATTADGFAAHVIITVEEQPVVRSWWQILLGWLLAPFHWLWIVLSWALVPFQWILRGLQEFVGLV